MVALFKHPIPRRRYRQSGGQGQTHSELRHLSKRGRRRSSMMASRVGRSGSLLAQPGVALATQNEQSSVPFRRTHTHKAGNIYHHFVKQKRLELQFDFFVLWLPSKKAAWCTVLCIGKARLSEAKGKKVLCCGRSPKLSWEIHWIVALNFEGDSKNIWIPKTLTIRR